MYSSFKCPNNISFQVVSQTDLSARISAPPMLPSNQRCGSFTLGISLDPFTLFWPPSFYTEHAWVYSVNFKKSVQIERLFYKKNIVIDDVWYMMFDHWRGRFSTIPMPSCLRTLWRTVPATPEFEINKMSLIIPILAQDNKYKSLACHNSKCYLSSVCLERYSEMENKRKVIDLDYLLLFGAHSSRVLLHCG